MAKSLNLYIADNFEALLNGKIAAMGMFTDRVVLLSVPADLAPPSRKMPYGVPLTLLLNLQPPGPDDIQGKLQVLPPGQHTPVMHTDVSAKGVPAGHSVNIIVHMQPLLVTAPGRYQVKLTIGPDTMTAHFEVRIATLPVQTAAPAAVAKPAEAAPAKAPRQRATPTA